MSSVHLSIAALVYVSSIHFRWELKSYMSKDEAKQNKLIDTQDRQTNWCSLRGGHSSTVMLPHMDEEPRAGRPPQPRQNKRKNPAHTKPSSGESEWKSGWRALTKDTEKAAEWGSLTWRLSVARLPGPWIRNRRLCLQQKNAFPMGSRYQCLLQAGQLCLGQQALSRNIAVLNLWSNRKPLEGWKFILNMVQSKEHAKGSWSVLENTGSEHPPHMLSSLPAKSRWNYHSAGVVLYKCKGADGSPPTCPSCWGYRDPCAANPAFPTPQPQSSPRAKATALLTHLLAPLLTVTLC